MSVAVSYSVEFLTRIFLQAGSWGSEVNLSDTPLLQTMVASLPPSSPSTASTAWTSRRSPTDD